MLVSFIGSPASGKTTTAAAVFSELKNSGQSVEFLPEIARFYIAKLRVSKGLSPSDKLSLDDSDQIQIMKEQSFMEAIMLQACGKAVTIISDSSPLNSLLYMSEGARSLPEVKTLVEEYLDRAPIVFYSKPVSGGSVYDPNRIHSPDFSSMIDLKIPEMLSLYGINAIALMGNSKIRCANSLHIIYEALSDGIR